MAVFALRGDLLVLRAPLEAGEAPPLPSLGAWLPAARWAERELLERSYPGSVGHTGRWLTRPDASQLDGRVIRA